VAREWLIIEVIVGIRREAHSLRGAVGIGSRSPSHCLLGDRWSSLATSDSVAGEKEESGSGKKMTAIVSRRLAD
jgi:hypothetical protein